MSATQLGPYALESTPEIKATFPSDPPALVFKLTSPDRTEAFVYTYGVDAALSKVTGASAPTLPAVAYHVFPFLDKQATLQAPWTGKFIPNPNKEPGWSPTEFIILVDSSPNP